MQALYYDTFNRSNSIGLGANWSNYLGQPTGNYFNVASSAAVANVYGDDTTTYYSGNTAPFPVNQFSQITVASITTAGLDGAGIGCIVRANAANSGIICYGTHNASPTPNVYLYASINGVFRLMANTPHSISSGDIILLTVVGNLFTVYINGIQLLQASDANTTNGAPGVTYSSTDSGTPLDGANNWLGGSMTTRPGYISFIE